MNNGLKIPILDIGTNMFSKKNNDVDGDINVETNKLLSLIILKYRLIDTAI
jgi:diketogulonate reductase-like aldo/keto reductase